MTLPIQKLSFQDFERRIESCSVGELPKLTLLFLARLDSLKVKIDGNGETLKAEKYQNWLKASQQLHAKLGKRERSRLNVSVTSLMYRAFQIPEILEVEQTLKDQLLDLIVPWKKKQLYTQQQLILTNDDYIKITELCRYPAFAKWLLEDEHVRHEFFTLVLLDYCPVSIVIRFYGLFLREFKEEGNQSFYMTSRLGYFKYAEKKNVIINLTKLDQNRRLVDLQVLVEGHYHSLYKPGELLQCSDGKTRLWAEIKADFSEINDAPAKLEFYENVGIRYIRPQRVAFEILDTQEPTYYKQLWSVTFPDEDFERRYKKKIPENHFVFCVDAACKPTEKGLRRNVTDAHGYWKLYVRDEKGLLRMWAIGKYAETFPQTFWSKIGFPGKTNKAEQTSPDPNEFLRRLHGSVPFFIPMNELEPFMQYVASQLNFLKFQWPDDSCSNDTQTKANFLLPRANIESKDFFRQDVLDVDMPPFYAVIFKPIKLLPEFLHHPIVHGISLMVGAKRELVLKDENREERHSLYQSAYTLDHRLSNPAHLLEGIERGDFEGVIYYGHDTSGDYVKSDA